MSNFSRDILKFNQMYKMPVADRPTVISAKRLTDFKSILSKELSEVDDILAKLGSYEANNFTDPELKLEILTDLADLLGDLQIYCASEMAKWGLPLNEVLSVIMKSNFSKMGADGQPIYDEQDKLQKGPDYWKPEPKIALLLQAEAMEADAYHLSVQCEGLQDKVREIKRDVLG